MVPDAAHIEDLVTGKLLPTPQFPFIMSPYRPTEVQKLQGTARDTRSGNQPDTQDFCLQRRSGA